MGIHSGKSGVVDGVSTVRTWSITDSMATHEYVASNTLYGTGRRNGVEEWSGSYGIYGHTPPAMPGELAAFVGYTAPDDDSTGPGLRYRGDHMVESLQVTWGWQGGDIISAVVNFKGHLGLTIDEPGAELLDLTVPRVPTSIGTKIQYSTDGVSFTEWTNLLTAQLTLSCKLQEYVNSSSVVGGRLWKGQKSGPVDWTLSVTEQDNRRNIMSKGDSLVFRLFVDDSEYFELKWGKVGEFTGITVDRETGAIIQQTVNVSMDGFDPSQVTYDPNSIGHVLLPDGTQWWPATQPGTGTP